jgi:hypothetical protein
MQTKTHMFNKNDIKCSGGFNINHTQVIAAYKFDDENVSEVVWRELRTLMDNLLMFDEYPPMCLDKKDSSIDYRGIILPNVHDRKENIDLVEMFKRVMDIASEEALRAKMTARV